MSEDLKNKILEILSSGSNVLFVGPTNSGKTYFVNEELIPYLIEKGQKIVYFKDGDEIVFKEADFYICDEAEILFDQKVLENLHPTERPYYIDSYLAHVRQWQSSYTKLTNPAVFVLTRNEETVIDYLLENYKKLEWNQHPVVVLKFNK